MTEEFYLSSNYSSAPCFKLAEQLLRILQAVLFLKDELAKDDFSAGLVVIHFR